MNVCFIEVYGGHDNNSDYLRGKYISENLKIENCTIKSIKINDLKMLNIKNHIIILVRGIISHIMDYQNIFEVLRERNIIVHDILDLYSLTPDWYTTQEYIKFESLFNYLIVNSYYMRNLIIQTIKVPTEVIYHMFDARLMPTHLKSNTPIYYGTLQKLSLNDSRDYIILKDLPYSIDSSIHFTFLSPEHPYFINHTSTKLSTALGSDSIFVANRIPVFVEILGSDYPFFVDSEEELHEKIIKAIELLNSDKYDKFIYDYRNKKLLLSPEVMLNNYRIFFTRIHDEMIKNPPFVGYVKKLRRISLHRLIDRCHSTNHS